MKKFFSLITAVVLLLSFSGFAPAHAESSLTAADEQALRDGFTEQGIDQQTQENLLEKIRQGQLIDSMKPENIEMIENEFNNLGMNESKTFTFEDGSKVIVGNKKVEDIDTGIITPFKDPGTYQVTSYWNTVVLNCSFVSEVKIVSGSNNDYIVSSGNSSVTIIGGSYSGKSLTIGRKTETSTRRAYSRLEFEYTIGIKGIGGQSTFDLYLHVGNNTYTSDLSLKDVK